MAAISNLNFFHIILFIFVAGCANQLPPTGGDADRIPPEIVEVFPLDGTTNFDEDYFEIEFSEYVDKRSVREAIFISPFIEGALEFDWSGTSVEVTFPEGLKEDLTYTITVGTDVVDRNNSNRMVQSFSFSFSTGDKIDRNIISGTVYGKTREGIYLYAYKLINGTDTLLFNKPNYVSQSGVNGSYILNGLASGTYRVFAVDDKFKDLLYQQDQDEIGIPHKDVILNDIDSIFTNLNFLLFNADTTKPRLISGVMTDKYHLLVTFNKELKIDELSADKFLLFDSTDNNQFDVRYLFKGRTKVTEEELNQDNQVYLQAESITDVLENVTLNDYTEILKSNRPDTTALKVISTVPDENGTIDFVSSELRINFDDVFSKDGIQPAISFTDTLKNVVPFNVNYYDDATLIISPLSDLKPEKDYLIKLNLSKFSDAAGNRSDSIFTLNFSTISGLDFTGLSGKLVATDTLGIDFNLNPILVLENSEREGLINKKILSFEDFEFTRIEPGKYLLWSFLDKNNDGEFSFGYPYPFEYSEQFYFYPDTLNLRPRWEITDLQFQLR
jgi:hypothetical protein